MVLAAEAEAETLVEGATAELSGDHHVAISARGPGRAEGELDGRAEPELQLELGSDAPPVGLPADMMEAARAPRPTWMNVLPSRPGRPELPALPGAPSQMKASSSTSSSCSFASRLPSRPNIRCWPRRSSACPPVPSP